MKKAMATHSSTRTWKIPWMEEPMYSSIFKYQKMLKNSKSKNNPTFKCLKPL